MLQSMGSQRVGLGLAPDKNKSYAQYHIRLTFTDIFFFSEDLSQYVYRTHIS